MVEGFSRPFPSIFIPTWKGSWERDCGVELWRSCIPADLHLHVQCGFCCLRSTEQRRRHGHRPYASKRATFSFARAWVTHWELGRRTAETERSKRQASLRFPMWPPVGFFFVTAGISGQGSALSSPPFLLHSKTICFRIWLTLQSSPVKSSFP